MSGPTECFDWYYLLLQGQRIDGYIMGDDFFVAKLDQFQHLMRDYRANFCSLSDERRDQGIFLYGQNVSFLHGNLRCILLCRFLPKQDDGGSLKCFEFLKKDLLENGQCMLKTSSLDRALSVVNEKIIAEKRNGEWVSFCCVCRINESYNPFLDACREFLKRVCEGLLQHPAWKSDLVVGPACFEYSGLFELSKSQCAECFKQLFESFSDRNWIAVGDRGRLKDCYTEFVDDL